MLINKQIVRIMKVQPDSVEIWAKGISARCTTPLNEEQGTLLINIFMNEEKFENDEKLKEYCENASKGGLIYMVMQRCKRLNIELTRSAALFLGFCLNSPGEVSMTAAYIKYCLSKGCNRKEKVSASYISTHCFSMGLPSEKDWQELWDAQKVDYEQLKIFRKESFAPDNMLDYNESYQTVS